MVDHGIMLDQHIAGYFIESLDKVLKLRGAYLFRQSRGIANIGKEQRQLDFCTCLADRAKVSQ